MDALKRSLAQAKSKEAVSEQRPAKAERKPVSIEGIKKVRGRMQKKH
jgi:hypothetical protein